ncbi:MAG: DUF3137 domain-containing protein [Proteobacteria bacterium]|nr:DUF3137 domain-containing protein [Pseudomonadota bacterium]
MSERESTEALISEPSTEASGAVRESGEVTAGAEPVLEADAEAVSYHEAAEAQSSPERSEDAGGDVSVASSSDETDARKEAEEGALFETECGQTVQNPSKADMPRVTCGRSKATRNSRDVRRQQAEMKRYVYPLDELKKHLRIDIGMMIGAPVLLLGALAGSISLGLWGGLFLFLASLAVLGFVFHDRLMHFRKSVKYSMVFNAIKKTFNPEVYLAYKTVDEDVLDSAGFSMDWSEAKMSDYFRGSWRGFPFSFGDISIIKYGDNKKLANTVYSGQLFVIETGLDLKSWITIHERETMLTPEHYEGQKQAGKFFTTGNAQFDRQFEVNFGVNGRDVSDARKEAARQTALRLVERLSQDMIAADAYVVSRTTMRFEGNYLYLATENARDTFELQPGDLKNLELLGRRFAEEVEAMTIYLDLVTKGLEAVKASEPSDAEPASAPAETAETREA